MLKGWEEAALLATLCIAAFAIHGFIELADEVTEGETQRVDERVLRSLRRADDPAVPIGPGWLRGAALDVTALGGTTVVSLVVAAVLGFLLLQRRLAYAIFVLAAAVGGMLLNMALKAGFERARPSVVPHLTEVATTSFPSGHAMLSAVVYLTLGTLLMRLVRRKREKAYCLGVALAATVLVGASRVYLGVHYPTDVLGGWAVGLAWALACWIVERLLERSRAFRRSAKAPSDAIE